ncbi:MAG: OmpA family protein [Leptospirales bacterium]|jgi:outer membrane protein OmpA-like peptidoglycan-associated protein
MTGINKRQIIAGGLLLALIVAGLFAYIFKERIYYRSPVLLIGEPRITFATGDVRFRRQTAKDWSNATVGSLLGTGYELTTGPGSAADIRFQSRTALRVKAESHIVLDEATIRGIRLRLERGRFYGQFKRLFQQQQIQVATPTATTYVRGTELGFELIEIDASELEGAIDGESKAKPKSEDDQNDAGPRKIPATLVHAISGIVEVLNPEFQDDRTILSYQNSALIPAGGPPQDPRKLSEREVERVRRILNSIHYDDVLLITNQLQFVFATAELLPESAQELDKIAELLQGGSDRVRIEGHTDNVGSSAANYRLSLARARAIRKALIERGVDEKRLLIGGHGENKPIADNDSEVGRQENRRVEFLIVE